MRKETIVTYEYVAIDSDKLAVADYDEGSVSLPCGKCTKCCQGGDPIVLRAEDDPLQYGEENLEIGIDPSNHYGFGHNAKIVMLKKKKNGDCIFLDRQQGCQVHDHAPFICRRFDCRWTYYELSKGSRVDRREIFRDSPTTKEMYNAGRSLAQHYPN